MKRREFLTTAGAALALSACKRSSTISGPGISQKKFRWKMVMIVPKTFPIWGPGMIQFAENVKIISRGSLVIDVYGANELVPALGVFDAVKGGSIEMGHSAAYYWDGKLPAAVFFTSIPFGMNANGMNSWLNAGEGQKLWDELYAPQNLKALPCGNTGVQMGGWFRKEINSIDDFKGLKMRMPGLGGKTIKKAGASPVLIPGAEIYTNLATGVIDATEWIGPYHDYIMKFQNVTKYYYSGGWHEPGSVLELLMNKKSWESLTPELKTIVKTCAAQTDRDMFAQWMAKDSEYYQKILDEKKVTVREYPVNVIRPMKKYAAEVLEEVRNSAPLAKKIHDSYKTFQRMYEQYQEVSERAYVRAQKA